MVAECRRGRHRSRVNTSVTASTAGVKKCGDACSNTVFEPLWVERLVTLGLREGPVGHVDENGCAGVDGVAVVVSLLRFVRPRVTTHGVVGVMTASRLSVPLGLGAPTLGLVYA